MSRDPITRLALTLRCGGAGLLFALLASASACEEVLGAHFDDYSEPDSACDEEPTCQECMQCGCLEEQDACLSSQDCADWVTCATSCSDSGLEGCQAECDAQYPAGRAIFDDYLYCSNEECSTACAVTT